MSIKIEPFGDLVLVKLAKQASGGSAHVEGTVQAVSASIVGSKIKVGDRIAARPDGAEIVFETEDGQQALIKPGQVLAIVSGGPEAAISSSGQPGWRRSFPDRGDT